MTRVVKIATKGTWRDVANAARTTINKTEGLGDPSSEWIRRMLLSEHSPIRKITIECKWEGLQTWVSTHLVRHKFGIEHFVGTQRTDRTGVDRREKSQTDVVVHEIEANQQAIINISRKRLCTQASTETKVAWIMFLESFKNIHPELYSVCVPDCVYRGHCYEYDSCGYHKTKQFTKDLANYRKGINE